jgi:hypothetical protein
MKLANFGIPTISDLIRDRDGRFAWAEVSIAFADDDCPGFPAIRIRVPVEYDREQTVDQIREVAFERARKVMSAANDLVATNDLHTLQGRSDKIEDDSWQQLSYAAGD